MTPPIAFVDCETTGVHPARRPWEIAIIRREPDGQENTTLIHITDIDLSQADPFGLRVGHFYERHWNYAPDSGSPNHPVAALRTVPDPKLDGFAVTEQAAAPIVERLTRGAHLVGAVPNFDAETFDAMLRRHRLIPAWHYHLIDVEAMAVGYLHGQLEHVAEQDLGTAEKAAFSLPWKSDDLSRACGVAPPSEEDRHTALGDALWAQRWYDAITTGGA